MRIAIIALLVISLFLASCSDDTGGTTRTNPFNGGTEGILVSFQEGMPPNQIFDDGQLPFAVQVKLENKGEDDVDPADMYVEITGINPQVFGTTQAALTDTIDSTLRGTDKNFDGTVINGDTGYITFADLAYEEALAGNTEVTFRANLCYIYETTAMTTLCINNDVIRNTNDNKICELSGSKIVYNSGAPIQVINVKQDPIGGGKIQISFDIVHVGPQNFVWFKDTESVCNDVITNMERYKVFVEVGDISSISPTCAVFEGGGSSGYMTMHNGQSRRVVCTMDLNSFGSSVFEDTLEIKLKYKYLEYLDKKVTVQDVLSNAN